MKSQANPNRNCRTEKPLIRVAADDKLKEESSFPETTVYNCQQVPYSMKLHRRKLEFHSDDITVRELGSSHVGRGERVEIRLLELEGPLGADLRGGARPHHRFLLDVRLYRGPIRLPSFFHGGAQVPAVHPTSTREIGT